MQWLRHVAIPPRLAKLKSECPCVVFDELHDLTQEELEIVLNLITMHSLDDALFVGEKRETFLFKILKDADALDRIRFSDLDPKYLRLAASLKLIEIAAELCQKQNN